MSRAPESMRGRGLAIQHLATVDRLVEIGRLADAEHQARAAIGADPTYGPAHAALSHCLVERGALAEAEDAARTAIGLSPEDHDVYHSLFEVLREKGDLRGAEQVAAETLRMAPTCIRSQQHLAWIHRDRHRDAEALEAAQSMLRLDPRSPDALNELALSLMRVGRHDEAEAAIRSALAIQPNSALLTNNLGVARHLRGDMIDSHRVYREAARIDPGLTAGVKNYESSDAFMRQRVLAGRPIGKVERSLAIGQGARWWWARRTGAETFAIVSGLAAIGLLFRPAWLFAVLGVWGWLGLQLEPRLARRWATRAERGLRMVVLSVPSAAIVTVGTALLLLAVPGQPLAGLLGLILVVPVLYTLSVTGRRQEVAAVWLLVLAAAGFLGEATMTKDLALVSLTLWLIALYGAWLAPPIVERIVEFAERG